MVDGAYKGHPEEELLTKYCVIMRFPLLVIQSMMDINTGLPQWATNVLTKNLETLLLTQEQALFVRITN